MRDWRRLGYWRTDVSIDRSVSELRKALGRHGIGALRTTTAEDPWTILVEWEQPTRANVDMVVTFEVTIPADELKRYTAAQVDGIKRQAVRLIFHTVKNMLDAVEAGIIALDEAFMSHFTTYRGGARITVGELVFEQIAQTGQLAPALVQRALPAGKP